LILKLLPLTEAEGRKSYSNMEYVNLQYRHRIVQSKNRFNLKVN